MRALVVDDDPVDFEIARALLTARGFDVTVASRAAIVKTVDISSVDLLLCDLSMPEFDGIEYLER